jgi:putative Mn2+ efflux pump MntP
MPLLAVILYFQALHRLVGAKVQMRTSKMVEMAAQVVAAQIMVVEELVVLAEMVIRHQLHHHKAVVEDHQLQLAMVVPVAVAVQVL